MKGVWVAALFMLAGCDDSGSSTTPQTTETLVASVTTTTLRRATTSSTTSSTTTSTTTTTTQAQQMTITLTWWKDSWGGSCNDDSLAQCASTQTMNASMLSALQATFATCSWVVLSSYHYTVTCPAALCPSYVNVCCSNTANCTRYNCTYPTGTTSSCVWSPSVSAAMSAIPGMN